MKRGRTQEDGHLPQEVVGFSGNWLNIAKWGEGKQKN